jgi:hypothetical protein
LSLVPTTIKSSSSWLSGGQDGIWSGEVLHT